MNQSKFYIAPKALISTVAFQVRGADKRKEQIRWKISGHAFFFVGKTNKNKYVSKEILKRKIEA